MSWTPTIERPEEPSNPSALSDVHPLLDRMIEAYSAATVARLLDVNAAMVTRWTKGGPISPEMTARILDLHAVISRAFQVFQPRHAMLWLLGSEPLLGGARPLDVLALRGAAPLIQALHGIEAGAYA